MFRVAYEWKYRVFFQFNRKSIDYRKMKILYIVSNSSLNPNANTGYGRHIRETVKGLKLLGHEVCLVCAFESRLELTNENKGHKSPSILKYWSKQMVPKILWETIKDMRTLRQLRSFEDKVRMENQTFKADLVYERLSYLSDVGLRIKEEFNIPLFIELNAPITDERKSISGNSFYLKKALRKELKPCRGADGILPVSEVLRQHLISKYHINAEKITVNHNGVGRAFALNKLEPGCDDGKTIGFIGSIMPYHGIELLIEASSILKERNLNHKMLIVGDGQELVYYENLVRSKSLDRFFEFTGGIPHEEIPAQMQRMSICVLPRTAWYCSPIKLFEYAMASKVVVASDQSCVKELIVDNENGMLVSNSSELADKCELLINNAALRNKLAASFHDLVVNNYLWEHNAKRMDGVFRQGFSSGDA